MATVTISLPDKIAKRVDFEASEKGFATRSEFIRDLLRKYFSGEFKFEEFKPVSLDVVRSELARTGKYSQEFIESVLKGLSRSSLYEN